MQFYALRFCELVCRIVENIGIEHISAATLYVVLGDCHMIDKR
jgi:hypothetical protein